MREGTPADARKIHSPVPAAMVWDPASATRRIFAPAKINLNLLVGAKRPDGYHPLDSLAAKISLYDRLTLSPRADGDLRLRCWGLECGPADENLALRAARMLAERRDVGGADIELEKAIPPGGGLGGGSSDAAAALVGLNRLWELNLSHEELAEPAACLGSDVPLFLGPATLRMTGRGERVEPIETADFFALLILPPLACPTERVYAAFDADPPGDPSKQLDPVELARPPSAWRGRLVNQLAEAAFTVEPKLRELHGRLIDALDVPVHLSGSGSSLFVLCDDRGEAESVLAAIPGDLREFCRLARKNPW